MKILNVPYAEKDQAKALGARWNKDRRTWYVPDGQATAPFEQWLVSPQPGDAVGTASAATPPKARVDAYAGKPVAGAHYFVLEHDCNPFLPCEQCAALLAGSGWQAAHGASQALLEAIRAGRPAP